MVSRPCVLLLIFLALDGDLSSVALAQTTGPASVQIPPTSGLNAPTVDSVQAALTTALSVTSKMSRGEGLTCVVWGVWASLVGLGVMTYIWRKKSSEEFERQIRRAARGQDNAASQGHGLAAMSARRESIIVENAMQRDTFKEERVMRYKDLAISFGINSAFWKGIKLFIDTLGYDPLIVDVVITHVCQALSGFFIDKWNTGKTKETGPYLMRWLLLRVALTFLEMNSFVWWANAIFSGDLNTGKLLLVSLLNSVFIFPARYFLTDGFVDRVDGGKIHLACSITLFLVAGGLSASLALLAWPDKPTGSASGSTFPAEAAWACASVLFLCFCGYAAYVKIKVYPKKVAELKRLGKKTVRTGAISNRHGAVSQESLAMHAR